PASGTSSGTGTPTNDRRIMRAPGRRALTSANALKVRPRADLSPHGFPSFPDLAQCPAAELRPEMPHDRVSRIRRHSRWLFKRDDVSSPGKQLVTDPGFAIPRTSPPEPN